MDDGVCAKVAELEGLTKQDEISIINGVTKLTIGLVMAMSARPQQVTTGVCERAEKKNRQGVVEKDAIWTPNFVGKHYHYNRETPVGEHASPRTHWRRGNFRGQRVGAGRTQVKMLWIEPTLVNA